MATAWHRRRCFLAAALVAALVAAGCTGGRAPETSAPTTTSTTEAWAFPALPPGLIPPPPDPGGGSGILNIHTRVESFRPDQTLWTASTLVQIRVSIDKASPKVGELVEFTIELSSAALPCCGVELIADDESTYVLGGGLACAPGAPQGPASVTYRQAHTYKRPGQISFRVTALAGTCGADTAGGVTGVILVS